MKKDQKFRTDSNPKRIFETSDLKPGTAHDAAAIERSGAHDAAKTMIQDILTIRAAARCSGRVC